VPLSALRRRIAENLVRARQSAAHLTTFNEVDMQAVMEIRSRYREEFQQQHGVHIGLMSFFVKACCRALAEFPEVNAMLDGEELVYRHYYDIGVAVSTDRGLLVPVLRDADRMSFAGIERAIASLAERAREKRITPDELAGGTFTITNGGVFGSLLSTPIPNYPQTAILGMHVVQKRPVAVGDQVLIRPMMYVALTYDHRVIDGREAVGFLVRVKRLVEDPYRLLLDS
jgi:2-oxoglutarate dehydrogenase E2 component (dihydrolipoamide succinyltransferase)